jgi:hypothetical protein
MSENSEENISMNLKLLSFVMSLLIAVIGYLTIRSLTSIDQNIVDLRADLQKKTDIVSSHETRIQILEKLEALKKEQENKKEK